MSPGERNWAAVSLYNVASLQTTHCSEIWCARALCTCVTECRGGRESYLSPNSPPNNVHTKHAKPCTTNALPVAVPASCSPTPCGPSVMPRAAHLGRRSWVGRHRQAERLGHLLRGRSGRVLHRHREALRRERHERPRRPRPRPRRLVVLRRGQLEYSLLARHSGLRPLAQLLPTRHPSAGPSPPRTSRRASRPQAGPSPPRARKVDVI